MLRRALTIPLAIAVSACAGGPGAADRQSAMQLAKQDIAFRENARTYSQFAVARYASLTDDPAVAADNYAKVARHSPDDSAIAERAVFSALLVGDVPGAITLARQTDTATRAETELVRLTLAVDAVASAQPETALSFLEQPWTSTYHATLARSLAAWIALESDPVAAIDLQRQAGGTDPVLAGVAGTLAAIMKLQTGDETGAMADLDALWQTGARLAIGTYAYAQQLTSTGQDEAALRRLQAFHDTVGRNPALDALADDIRSGTAPARQSLSTRDGIALAFYAATAALANQDRGDLPSVYFALTLHLDPELDAARTLWADTLDSANRRPEAIALLNQVEEGSVYHTNAQGQLAWALRREGRNQEALDLAQATLERTRDRNIRVQLADLLQSLGRDGEAEHAFTQIIEDDAADGVYDWRIYYARGAARERLGEWPPAEDDLKTALGLNPEEPSIMNYLGYGWIDRGQRLEDGLRLIESALQRAPRSGAITDSLGWAHFKLGNYDRAVFYLERATELSPQDAEILDHLGDAYWQTGRYTEASYQWQRALRYSQDAEISDLIEQKIEGGFALVRAAENSAGTGVQ